MADTQRSDGTREVNSYYIGRNNQSENDLCDESGDVIKKARRVFLTDKILVALEIDEACRLENVPELPLPV
ncbi:MAG: hypothetical protein AAF902_19520 [Chloroflexota bacterium]